jgi:hypothetical protein
MGCLLGPPIGGVLAFVLTASTAFATITLVCVSVLSWALIRYVFIDPRHAKYLAASSIATTALICVASIWMSRSATALQITYQALKVVLPKLELPDAAGNDWASAVATTFILLAALGAIFLLLRSARSEKGDLREASAITPRQLAQIRRALQDHLDSLDEHLRFFDFRSTAIDPKLELLNSTSRYVSVKSAFELVSSAYGGQFIVVKGEPGSGKSVLLRNLTRRLLARVEERGKIPLLLNLREWPVDKGLPHEQALNIDLGQAHVPWTWQMRNMISSMPRVGWCCCSIRSTKTSRLAIPHITAKKLRAYRLYLLST